jgi:hypothetical protein
MGVCNNMSKKTAIFFNGDYHIQRTLSVKELYEMPLNEIYNVFYDKYSYSRGNTGCYLFSDAFVKLFDSDFVGSKDFGKLKDLQPKSLITAVLNTISPTNSYSTDSNYWNKLLDLLPDTKIVTMSLGFSNYYINNKISDDMCKVLKRFSERTPIGVRGEYSASVLEKNGIKNSVIIGCPSLFYNFDRDFQINNHKKSKVERLNYTAEFCNSYGKKYLENIPKYISSLYKKGNIEIQSTFQHHFLAEMLLSGEKTWQDNIIKSSDNPYFDLKLNTGMYYFDVDSWKKGVSKFDFSFGAMLHGHIVCLLSGVPALFIRRDERISDFCRYFKFPSINLNEFDKNKPIEYYYEKADYSEFNKNYKDCFDNFINYCNTNEVSLYER